MYVKIISIAITVFVYSICIAQDDTFLKTKIQQDTVNTSVPDYNNLYYWASHPQKKDAADSIPNFLIQDYRDSVADVFFIHPTTFTKGIFETKLNANINDTVLNYETDKKSILLQATVFNGSCRIFAPRYRQAHLKTFFNRNAEKNQQALELAFTDIKNAFENYLQNYNQGRPIIIAGHSQGAFHAIRLIQQYFDNKPLQKKLVCAYVVGWQIKNDDFLTIPFGKSPLQTGCILGWRSYRNKTIDPFIKNEQGNSLCVNPISWTTNNTYTNLSEHKGMVGRKFDTIYANTITTTVEPEAKILWVNLPQAQDESKGLINNFHIADFNLFFMDIRKNVRDRINAYQNKK